MRVNFTGRKLRLSAVALGALGIAASSLAQDTTSAANVATDPASSDWEFSLTIPLWVSSLDAHLEARGVEADSHVSFGDILSDLDLGLLTAVEARKDKLSLVGTLIWMRISDDQNVTLGGGGLPFPPIESEVQMDTVIFEAIGGWEVMNRALTSQPEDARRIRFDLRGGVRYWFLGTEIEADLVPPLPSPPFHREFDSDQRFADLILGGRVRFDLADRLALVAAGDYGGFHISSKSTWSFNTQLVWELGEHWRLLGGYRMLDLKRDHADVRMQGPILGATYAF